jgi:hypothetical protein
MNKKKKKRGIAKKKRLTRRNDRARFNAISFNRNNADRYDVPTSCIIIRIKWDIDDSLRSFDFVPRAWLFYLDYFNFIFQVSRFIFFPFNSEVNRVLQVE